MKKLLLIIIVLVLSNTIKADPLWYKLNKFSFREINGEWFPWQNVDLLMVADFDKKHIVIYSKETQIFDYISLSPTRYSDRTELKSMATDSHYKAVELIFLIYEEEFFLKISYNNIEYIYEITSFAE